MQWSAYGSFLVFAVVLILIPEVRVLVQDGSITGLTEGRLTHG